MKKTKGKIEWTVADNEEAWQASQAATQLEPVPKAFYRKEVTLVALIVTLLFLAAGWLWLRQAPGKRASQEAPSTLLQVEQPLTRTLESPNHPIVAEVLQRTGNHIIAQVIMNYPEEGNMRAYRETRFYMRNNTEWIVIPPDPALLGPQRSLSSANFTIHYRDVDADAVYQAVPRLEQLYTTMRHDVGLPAVIPGLAYTIEVVAGSTHGGNSYDDSSRTLVIYSPTLLSAPVEIAPATLIEQATVYPLAQMLIHELSNQHDVRWQYSFSRWSPVEDALPLWELWQEDGPLAVHHTDVIAWLYRNSKNSTNRQPLPTNYTELCRTHRVWQVTPAYLSVPLICDKEDTAALSANDYPALDATWPQQIRYPSDGISPISAPLTLESILEYIVATYGRDKLPQLLAALGEHSTADTLIPTLFGVSRSDFEAAWQAYLAQQY